MPTPESKTYRGVLHFANKEDAVEFLNKLQGQIEMSVANVKTL
jgi:hypothetical protein